MLTPVRTARPALPIFVILLGLHLTVPASANLIEDRDGDGVVDTVDQDDDNDGIEDRIELSPDGRDRDSDGDGVPDRIDLDSDNDGIPDLFESGLFVSVSGFDVRVVNGRLFADVGENGLVDNIETSPDSSFVSFTILNSDQGDGDVVPDYLDLDSDNDGILDLVEAGVSPEFDRNGDGRIDAAAGAVGNDGILDDLQLNIDLSCCDLDFDGTQDQIPRNSDGGDLPDFQDLDSDNDGINDLIEAGGRDRDQDGRIDNFFDDANQPDGVDDELFIVPLTPPDTDGNGLADYIDSAVAILPESAPELVVPVVVEPEPEPPVTLPPVVEAPEEPTLEVDADDIELLEEGVDTEPTLLDDATSSPIVPIQTGLNGGVGCVIGTPNNGARDSGLILLLLVAFAYLGHRRINGRINKYLTECRAIQS